MIMFIVGKIEKIVKNFQILFWNICFSDLITHCLSMENVTLDCVFFSDRNFRDKIIELFRTAKGT